MHRKFLIFFPITQEVVHLPLSLHSSTCSLELPMGRQWAARTKLKNQQENNKNVSLRCSKPVTSRKNETFFFSKFLSSKKVVHLPLTCCWPTSGRRRVVYTQRHSVFPPRVVFTVGQQIFFRNVFGSTSRFLSFFSMFFMKFR